MSQRSKPMPMRSHSTTYSKGAWLNFLVMLLILAMIIFSRCQAPEMNHSWIDNFILPRDLQLPKSINDLVKEGKRETFFLIEQPLVP